MFGIKERRELDLIIGKYLLCVEKKSNELCQKLFSLAPSILENDVHREKMMQHIKAALAVCLIFATKLSYSHSKYANHVMESLAKSAPAIFAICSKDYLSFVFMQFYLDKKNKHLYHVFKTVATNAVVISSEKEPDQIDKHEFSAIFKIIVEFLDDETASITQPYLKFERCALVPQD